jgi:hypothetical protein
LIHILTNELAQFFSSAVTSNKGYIVQIPVSLVEDEFEGTLVVDAENWFYDPTIQKWKTSHPKNPSQANIREFDSRIDWRRMVLDTFPKTTDQLIQYIVNLIVTKKLIGPSHQDSEMNMIRITKDRVRVSFLYDPYKYWC